MMTQIDPQQNEIRPYGPGKFDTMIDSYLYDMSLDGCDEDCGNSEITGWYGLVTGTSTKGLLDCVPADVVPTAAEREFLAAQAGAILTENSQGFVSVEWYTDLERCILDYRQIEDEINQAESEDDAEPA